MENKEQKSKKKIYKRWWFWVLVVFLFLIVIGSFGNSSDNQQSSQTPDKGKSYNVGDLVIAGKTTWKVVIVKDLGETLVSDNQFIESKKTSGKFIKVTFEVTNNDTSLQSVGNLKIIDDKGREFTPSADVSYFIPNNESLFILDNINPGITKRYTVIFDIPKDAVGLKLQPGGAIILHDTFINLGI